MNTKKKKKNSWRWSDKIISIYREIGTVRVNDF